MRRDVEIRNAQPEDLPAVLARLSASSLPGAGLPEHVQHFLVAHVGGELIGAVGMLERSAAVAGGHTAVSRQWVRSRADRKAPPTGQGAGCQTAFSPHRNGARLLPEVRLSEHRRTGGRCRGPAICGVSDCVLPVGGLHAPRPLRSASVSGRRILHGHPCGLELAGGWPSRLGGEELARSDTFPVPALQTRWQGGAGQATSADSRDRLGCQTRRDHPGDGRAIGPSGVCSKANGDTRIWQRSPSQRRRWTWRGA